MRHSAALLAILGLACDGSGPSELSLDVSATRTFGEPLPPAFLAEAPQLTITGTIQLDVPCYDFGGALEQSADTLVVRLRATRQPGTCPQEQARFNYRLLVTGLSPGVQPLRLMYDRVGPPTASQVAFEGAVEVQ